MPTEREEESQYEADTDADNELEDDEQAPIRKKTKVAKIPLREAVKAIRATESRPTENAKVSIL